MTIVLTYTKVDGSQEHSELKEKVAKIDLSSKEIASIDLSPLSACKKLREIDLHSNELQSVDFAPLSTCTSLRNLDISENQLQTINLQPLSSCSSLMMLNLSKNQLPVIDLVPLRTCTELSELNLGDNRLRYIDLSPLRNCPQLENIRLYRNYLKEETIVRICSEPGPIDSSVHVVVADSAAIEMTVTTSSKVIDISKLAECRQLIELTIQQCKNLETIDLSPLNGHPTLQVIKIIYNGSFEKLILPSRCTNLEGVMISHNKKELEIPENGMIVVYRPVKTLKIDGWPVLPSERPKVTVIGGFPITWIDGAPSVQRSEYSGFRFEERFKRKKYLDEITMPEPINLSALDGSSSLRAIVVEDNHTSVILPSECSNLEGVFLERTRIQELRMDECPNIRLITLVDCPDELNYRRFLMQYMESQKTPVIFINNHSDWPMIESHVVDFKCLSKKDQERFVYRHEDKRWDECEYHDWPCNFYPFDFLKRQREEEARQAQIEQKQLERMARLETKRLYQRTKAKAELLDKISNCESAEDLDTLLLHAHIEPEDVTDVATALEEMILGVSPPLSTEFAYVVLNHRLFKEHFVERLPLTVLGIRKQRSHDSEELIQALREILRPLPQGVWGNERAKHFSNMRNACVKVLNHFFQDYRNDNRESTVLVVATFLNKLDDAELESIFYLALLSLQTAHADIILDWFSQDKMLDAFSNFLGKSLRVLDGFSYELDEKESLRSFLNSVPDSRIAEGIASFIANQEMNSYDLFFTVILISAVPSLARNEIVSNAILKYTDALCNFILSRNGEDQWGYWCWETIRILERIPLVINNKEIQTAISRQIEFIEGSIIFGLPGSDDTGNLLNYILEIQVLLEYNEIRNAICFCLHFMRYGHINYNITSRASSMDVMLKSPLIREALQISIDVYGYDISLPSKYNREFSAKEVKEISNNIKETAYPFAMIMTAYFTPRAWKHAAIRESAVSRLDDVAVELESGHHEKYDWWNYTHNYIYAIHFLQIDIIFENEAVVSALRKRKSELLRYLGGSDEDAPKESLEKAFSALESS